MVDPVGEAISRLSIRNLSSVVQLIDWSRPKPPWLCTSGLSTRLLETSGLIVKQDAVLAKAAKEAGLKLEQLRGHVSTEVQSQAITKTSYTPFVNIVSG